MNGKKNILRSLSFILILTGVIFLSCKEPEVGLVLQNNAAEAYRFTGRFYDGWVNYAIEFDKIIQSGESYNYDNTNKKGGISFYGNFLVCVYDLEDNSKELKSKNVFIPMASDKDSVILSWDGTNFTTK